MCVVAFVVHVAWATSVCCAAPGPVQVLGQVSWMPVLVLAARMCPAGVEVRDLTSQNMKTLPVEPATSPPSQPSTTGQAPSAHA